MIPEKGVQKAKTRMGRTIGQIGTRETSVTARAKELAIGIGPCPQITISASGFRTCRQGRPDRGPRSITCRERLETSCITDGNHRGGYEASAGSESSFCTSPEPPAPGRRRLRSLPPNPLHRVLPAQSKEGHSPCPLCPAPQALRGGLAAS